MEILEIVLIALMILGALVSLIIGTPMRKHLLAETKIKSIGLFQITFYLKDYNKMIEDTDDPSKKRKYRSYLIIFMVANLGFIVFGAILLLMP